MISDDYEKVFSRRRFTVVVLLFPFCLFTKLSFARQTIIAATRRLLFAFLSSLCRWNARGRLMLLAKLIKREVKATHTAYVISPLELTMERSRSSGWSRANAWAISIKRYQHLTNCYCLQKCKLKLVWRNKIIAISRRRLERPNQSPTLTF